MLGLQGRDPLLRWTVCLVVGLCLGGLFLSTRNWQLVNDAAQIDYICYLMDHGMAPYRDILDINMPGSYLVNWAVMHTLGPSALAWRVFDLGVMVFAGVAMFWIARPYDWLAGVFGGGLFALFHGRDGAGQLGQRDLLIAALLIAAYAFMFEALRRRRTELLFFFGICAGGAVMIKPLPAPFILFLLIALAIKTRQQARSVWSAVGMSVAGMMLPVLIVVTFLIRFRSLSAFLHVVRVMLPYYAGLGREPMSFLLAHGVTSSILTFFLLGLMATLGRTEAWDSEQVMLLCGVVFGVFSYLEQGKGFPYHRYPMMGFLLIWVAIQIVMGLRGSGLGKAAAYAGLVFGLATAPLYVRAAERKHWDEQFNASLSRDLIALGNEKLSGGVQCFATYGDCDTTLYRLHLVQSTGLICDYFVFGDGKAPVIREGRQRVWTALVKQRPRVIVVARGLYPYEERTYGKLALWPEFESYLQTRYKLVSEHAFPIAESGDRGYRIYVPMDSSATGKVDRRQRSY